MAGIAIYLTSQRVGLLAQETMPLDVVRLSAAPLRAGRDWLLLQGREDAGLCASVAWEKVGSSARLHIELRDGRGRPQWLGLLPPEEIERYARRAASALAAAGAWPRLSAEDDRELLYKVVLDAGDPTPEAPRTLAASPPRAPRLGIEVADQPRALLLPAVREEDLVESRPLVAEDRPDVVLCLAEGIAGQVRSLSRASAHAGEERALLLYGLRCRLQLSAGGAALPLFQVTEAVRPRLLEATATRIVFAKDALIRSGRGPVALLHTHLPSYGLDASEQDLLDLEDLDHGGPGALSVIVEARAEEDAAFPAFKIHARLGARGGTVTSARARLLSGLPTCPTPSENRR